jgi:hypothetical protein
VTLLQRVECGPGCELDAVADSPNCRSRATHAFHSYFEPVHPSSRPQHNYFHLFMEMLHFGFASNLKNHASRPSEKVDAQFGPPGAGRQVPLKASRVWGDVFAAPATPPAGTNRSSAEGVPSLRIPPLSGLGILCGLYVPFSGVVRINGPVLPQVCR